MSFDIFMNIFTIITTILSIFLTIIGLKQSSDSMIFITQYVDISYEPDYAKENYQTKKSLFSLGLAGAFGILILYVTIKFLSPELDLENSKLLSTINLTKIITFYYSFEKRLIIFSIVISFGLLFISMLHKKLETVQKVFFVVFYLLTIWGFFTLFSILNQINNEDLLSLFAKSSPTMIDTTIFNHIIIAAYIILAVILNVVILVIFIVSVVYPFTLSKSLKNNLSEYSLLAMFLFVIFIPIIFFHFFL